MAASVCQPMNVSSLLGSVRSTQAVERMDSYGGASVVGCAAVTWIGASLTRLWAPRG